MTQTHLATFNGTPLQVINHNNQQWLTGEQIGIAIGLKHARTSIRKLYKRHADEFTEQMTGEVNVASPSGYQKTRIFSPRGAWMLAMWAQTSKAKQFRSWVLDVLEQQAQPELTGLDIPTHIRKEILSARPIWQKISHYKSLGLNHAEIGKLVNLAPSTIRENVRRMERCGIIEPPANLMQLQHHAKQFLAPSSVQ